MTEQDLINKAMNELYESIELQPHQEQFCSAKQDLVFFGGGA